jgi:hypothetical protein
LALSCQRKAPEPLVPAAGTIRAVERAVDDISVARCEYEQRCKRIGAEMRYSDRDHCMSVMRSEAQEDLNQCHAGVDQDDLRECLTQITNGDCGGAFQQLEQYKACELDDLCD